MGVDGDGFGPVRHDPCMGDALLDSALGDALLDSASSLIWVGDNNTNLERGYGPVCKIRARRDALSYFSAASSLIWVGDSKTNFEGGPVCKIHARRDALSDFSLASSLIWVGDCKTNFWDTLNSSPHVFNPRLRCRPDARFVDLLTDGMLDFF